MQTCFDGFQLKLCFEFFSPSHKSERHRHDPEQHLWLKFFLSKKNDLHLESSHVIERHDGQHDKDTNRVSDRTADKRPIFLTHGGAAETPFFEEAVETRRPFLSTVIATSEYWTRVFKICTLSSGTGSRWVIIFF